MRSLRTIRARVAVSIGLAVFGSAVAFSVTSGLAFYLHESAESAALQRSPEHEAAEEQENLAVLLKMAGATALLLPLALAASAGLGLKLATRALAPMRDAAAQAQRARSGAFDLMLPLRGLGDEWDELAGVMNELLREQKESIAREKTFSANAAHELRTPLTAMLGDVQVALRRERSASELRGTLQRVETDALRLSSLVDALLMLARADAGQLRSASALFDLAEVARSAVQRAETRHGAGRAALVAGDAPVGVVADPLLTGRVLESLVDNALRHGAHRVTVYVAHAGASGVVRVVDDGPGLAPEVRARLFERFNKSAGSHEGFGLGLAIAHALVRAQGGTLRLDEEALATTFVLHVPFERPRRNGAGDRAAAG